MWQCVCVCVMVPVWSLQDVDSTVRWSEKETALLKWPVIIERTQQMVTSRTMLGMAEPRSWPYPSVLRAL